MYYVDINGGSTKYNFWEMLFSAMSDNSILLLPTNIPPVYHEKISTHDISQIAFFVLHSFAGKAVLKGKKLESVCNVVYSVENRGKQKGLQLAVELNKIANIPGPSANIDTTSNFIYILTQAIEIVYDLLYYNSLYVMNEHSEYLSALVLVKKMGFPVKCIKVEKMNFDQLDVHVISFILGIEKAREFHMYGKNCFSPKDLEILKNYFLTDESVDLEVV